MKFRERFEYIGSSDPHSTTAGGSADRVFKELLRSGKFKRYCYAKCGRVVKTRVSGGKIRQDIKIENQ